MSSNVYHTTTRTIVSAVDASQISAIGLQYCPGGSVACITGILASPLVNQSNSGKGPPLLP